MKKKPIATVVWDVNLMGLGYPAVRVDINGVLAKAFGMMNPDEEGVNKMLDYLWELQEGGYELKF